MRIHLNIKALTLFVFLTFYAFAKAQTAQVQVSQDPKIPELLILKSKLTNDNELADRYKIQVYSGNLGQAEVALRKFRNKVGTWSSSIEYETPNYKVWIGNFRNRLEADRALIKIKKEFPNALIFKPDSKR
jgi:hypothetical protein